jgi:hypothetical protein
VSPNGLPLEQEIRVILHPIIFFIRLEKRKIEGLDEENESQNRKKEKLIGV